MKEHSVMPEKPSMSSGVCSPPRVTQAWHFTYLRVLVDTWSSYIVLHFFNPTCVLEGIVELLTLQYFPPPLLKWLKPSYDEDQAGVLSYFNDWKGLACNCYVWRTEYAAGFNNQLRSLFGINFIFWVPRDNHSAQHRMYNRCTWNWRW